MNTWSWIAWLACSLVFISANRNPLYLILLLVDLNILFLAFDEPSDGNSLAIVSPIKFALVIVAMSTLFNALTSHFGATVLFTIPGALPLISGPVTLEALVFGFTNGLVLAGILTAFMIVNLVLPISALIRLAPRAFYPLSIVVSIAVTFLPSTRRRIDQVLEAQAIRGHRLSGLRDWAPLVMPLLIGGLESAMQLAETMTARGFASSAAGSTRKTRALISAGMLLVAAGWILGLLQGLQIPGAFLLLGGVALIGAALRQVGRQTPRTAFKKETWVIQDFLMTGAFLGLIALALFGPPQSIQSTLSYQPYPKVTLPGFEVAIGLLIQTLLLPILTRRTRRA